MAAVEYRSLRMCNCVFEISMQQTHRGPSADIFCPWQLEGQSQLECVCTVGKADALSTYSTDD